MNLQEARSRHRFADRCDHAAFVASLYTAPLVIVICLPTIVMIAARSQGVLGLIIGIVVGIPASVLISEIVSLLSCPLWEALFWIIRKSGKTNSKSNEA